MEDFTKEIHTSQIRERLNERQIKLWLKPYFIDETGPCNKELENISNEFSKLLNIESQTCYEIIKSLQTNALNRIKENKHFNETGVATLKIKYISSKKESATFPLTIKLNEKMNDLLNKVSEHIGIESDKIKLIGNGKVLSEYKNFHLQTLGLKNGKLIMALDISNDSADSDVPLTQKLLDDTKADAAFLTGRSARDANQYIQIADQSGKPLYLPENEQKALIIAMALHEKGRAALKKSDYSLALVFFLEADKEFSICQSSILEQVDNYALLNLDIAWTYLCLRSISHLNDVEKRLNFCEQKFKKSYGQNLERLLLIKGTIGKETALFMRLHLLQAIINFHLARFEKSRELLLLAEHELSCLRVDESKVLLLAELGYPMADARLALRVTHGEVIGAEAYLARKKQQKVDDEKKDQENRKTLVGMGFLPNKVSKALLKARGDFKTALAQLIEDQKNAPSTSGASTSRNNTTDSNKINNNTPNNNNTNNSNNNNNTNNSEPSTSNSPGTFKKSEEIKLEEEAYQRLSEGIATHEEDHLNLLLENEEMFLLEYKSLLENHFTPKN